MRMDTKPMIQERQTNAPPSGMRLYDQQKRRLYVNSEERERFLTVARSMKGPVATLALTLAYTGCRISEALELTSDSIQLEEQIISVRCLKKRNGRVIIREVPIPRELADRLNQEHHIALSQREVATSPRLLWTVCRKSAWEQIKSIMAAAEIYGLQATPKGLRHGYGVHAIRTGIQLNMLQKWMGHASMTTTAIYANASGREELEVARRMW